jgi:uncharacterized protein
MIFVDSGYLFALLSSRDGLHVRSQAWSRTLTEQLLTTEYVLWEVMNQFSGRASRSKAHEAIEDVRNAAEWEVIASSPALFQAGLAFYRQHVDKDWSLTDCVSFLVMRDRGILRALTHDHHFEQAGFEALLRRDPP